MGPDAGLVGFCPEFIDPISKRSFIGSLKITVYQILSSVDDQVKIQLDIQLDSKPFVIYDAGALPEVFGTLTNLKILHINKNKLTGLPDSFGYLTSLEQLDIYRNQLTVFPEVLTSLPNLRQLNVAENSISNIPGSIQSLQSLTSLNLYDVPITEENKTRIQTLLPNCEIRY